MRNIGLIVGREFRERVYKKSFIITTILMPLLMILMGAAPTLIMEFVDGSTKKIAVIDESGLVAPRLVSDEELVFELSDKDLQQALIATSQDEESFGVLHIGKDIVENPNDARLYTTSSSSLVIEETIADQIEKVIESERLKAYNIENIDEILEKVKASVHLTTFRTDKEEDSAATSAVASSLIGMLLGFLLYFILAIYGSMVMQSVIDEKSSRILEVMVSTVKPFEMLMGKILGIAAVAATQVLVWGVLIVLFSSVILPAIMPENILDSVQQVQAGADVSALATQQDLSPEMLTAMASLLDTGHLAMIIGTVLLYLIGGFLLYASLYAAVGASVDQAQDAQQLTTIITLPIIVSFIVTMMVMKDPNSPVVFWCSMIPFTAPIVMVARIPSGIPAWEIATSLALLYATFTLCVWGAAKIYKIGIFMHGAKPTIRDMWRWLKY
ncbi:MAG: ABC transporter permease [Rikenellaceae bacterium]|nr:ABC transporter permease [Rikenellaceae bacterium]